jgi:predicted metalloprotease with PDZ domain
MRVDEASGGHGNSNGYLISYYNLGWLAGMCLDIELRTRTNNKYCLDDIEHALWNECRDGKPGFAEDEIRKLCVRFGGEAMGPVYDRIAMQPNMPVLEVTTKAESFVDIGFAAGGAGGPGAQGAGGIRVSAIRGPAEGKLMVGDTILTVNGAELNGVGRARAGALAAATRDAVAGTPIKLSIKRGDQTVDVEVTPVTATRDVLTVDRLANPTPEQKKAADDWLARKTIG